MRFAPLVLLIATPALAGAQALSTGVNAPVTPDAVPAATAWVRDSGTALVAAFLAQRRAAWQASEVKRHRTSFANSSMPGFGGDVRLQRAHCHGDYGIEGVEIASPSSHVRYCPGYPPAKLDTIPGDERTDADASLLPAQRDSIHAARAALLDRLAALARAAPGDSWIIGQQLRFTVEQHDTTAARALATRCPPSDAWCGMLRGWTEAQLGDLARAEAAFDSALAAMPDQERCRWTDIEPLLDGRRARSHYHALPCPDRAREERRFWWLADPMLSEPGNARRAEHFARRVTVALHAAVPQDDRMHWSPAYGGDALAAMIVRFGWPAYFWWAGEDEDASHRDWTQQQPERWSVPPTATFWSAEYSLGRLQLTPDESQWDDPFAAGAWTATDAVAPLAHPRRWKPREHWVPPVPLALLADEQVALLRRAEGTLVVVATDPASVVGRRLLVPDGDSLVAALVLTTSPDSTLVLAERRVAASGLVTVSGLARRGGPALLAVELRPARAPAGNAAPNVPRRRARVALTLPSSLTGMDDGERAISTPVLLEAGNARDGEVDDSLPALAQRMLGGTTLTDGAHRSDARVALYWESYGWRAGDTLEVTLRVRRVDRGALSRLAGALRVPGLGSEGSDAAAVHWTELPRGTTRADAPRLRMWTRTLDLRTLPAGRYEVEVSVSHGVEPPVSERRRFAIGDQR